MRPSEVKLVTELLESEASDVEALAKAVITQLDLDREKRDSWVVRVSLGGETFGLGPYITQHQALLAARMMRPGVEDDVLLLSVARLVSPRILGDDAIDPETKSAFICEECGHPTIAHSWPKAKVSGCVVGYQTGKPETGCQCGRARRKAETEAAA